MVVGGSSLKQKGGVVMNDKKRGRRRTGGDARKTASIHILVKEDVKQKLLEIESILKILHKARVLQEMCGRTASISTTVELLTEEYADSLIKKLLREAEKKTEQLEEIKHLISRYLGDTSQQNEP